jgi:hypothetical protein
LVKQILLTYNRHSDLPFMGCPAVLEEKDPLPGA